MIKTWPVQRFERTKNDSKFGMCRLAGVRKKKKRGKKGKGKPAVEQKILREAVGNI
jgi:hypothetical protein